MVSQQHSASPAIRADGLVKRYGNVTALAGVSFAVMQTLVVPALPFFQREFDTSATSVTWIATGFLLSSSVLTPILGKLGDAYGKKRLLVISLGIFGLASLGAAAASNPSTPAEDQPQLVPSLIATSSEPSASDSVRPPR
jgi:MFS family permease